MWKKLRMTFVRRVECIYPRFTPFDPLEAAPLSDRGAVLCSLIIAFLIPVFSLFKILNYILALLWQRLPLLQLLLLLFLFSLAISKYTSWQPPFAQKNFPLNHRIFLVFGVEPLTFCPSTFTTRLAGQFYCLIIYVYTQISWVPSAWRAECS